MGDKCMSCKVELLQPGGFYGTDLCGPCCCGEAHTAGKLSYECPEGDGHGAAELLPHETPKPCPTCGNPLVLTGKRLF